MLYIYILELVPMTYLPRHKLPPYLFRSTTLVSYCTCWLNMMVLILKHHLLLNQYNTTCATLPGFKAIWHKSRVREHRSITSLLKPRAIILVHQFNARRVPVKTTIHQCVWGSLNARSHHESRLTACASQPAFFHLRRRLSRISKHKTSATSSLKLL